MFIFVRLLRFAMWSGALALSGACLVASAFYLVLGPNLPNVEQLRDVQLQIPLRLFSSDGKLIGEFGEQRRTPVSIEDVPEDLVQAFLAAEDSRFYEHSGVDIKGLSRATVELISTGSIQSGGSTITMQVAKNYFLSQERTFSRKFNEILLALKIENELTKPEILELYFNKIYLGNRAYGIEAAANVYYGKSLSELTLAQKAMIAGLPKAPSRYNPLASPVRATIRRNWILQRMHDLDMISESALESARGAPVSADYFRTQPDVEAPYVAEMARVQALALLGPTAYTGGYRATLTVDSKLQSASDQAVRKGLIAYSKRHGYRGPIGHMTIPDPLAFSEEAAQTLSAIPNNAHISPAWVTAIDDEAGSAKAYLADGTEIALPFDSMTWANRFESSNRQGPSPEKVSDVLSSGDIVYVEPLQEDGFGLAQKPAAQSALVALAPEDGAILALTGGFDFYMSKFNRANQARRQPGSNFKPFVYLAGLEQGVTAASVFNDAPVVFDDDELETAWRPENSSGRFYGPTRLRKALYLSRNLVSIRLLRRLGIRETISFLDNFGFDRKRLPMDLSLALGSATFTPMEIARGYAILANGGHPVTPYIIREIRDSEGATVYPAQPQGVTGEIAGTEASGRQGSTGEETSGDSPEEPSITKEPQPLADPRNIYILTDMLKDVVRRGTATDARSLNRSDLAGKTGTTNDQVDAWFSGYNNRIATSVWVGFDQPQTLGRREYGSRAALPIWIDFMGTALKGKPQEPTPRPDGIVSVRIDPETGERALPGQPDAIFELFTVETTPAERDSGSESDSVSEDPGSDIFMPESLF